MAQVNAHNGVVVYGQYTSLLTLLFRQKQQSHPKVACCLGSNRSEHHQRSSSARDGVNMVTKPMFRLQ